ncbi:MAG TPA: hypothetical protein VGN34_29255 [Ktedonobacteraceae bacterium]
MPDIRYVCLSDMHLGADKSVLTNIQANSIETNTTEPSPTLIQLVACLRELIAHNESQEKPILILNGDILEMALTETNKAAMVFERFIELIFPKDGEPLFAENILYIPGNHDHHIWESARETQYVNFICRIQAGAQLEVPWHTTKMFAPDFVREYFLTNLIQRYPHLTNVVVNVVYPNYALLSGDGQKCVIFNHGHYVEPLYSLMSTLNTMIFPDRETPKVIRDLEAENFAWVDFFWSTMGRSGGDVGQNIGLLYDKLQDKRQLEKLITTFAASLIEKYNHVKWAEGVEAKGLAWLLNLTLGRTATLERRQPAQVLSPAAQQGLQSYVEGPLLEQIRLENKQSMPKDVTFLFGHTHKPFQQDMTFTGYPQWINVYNSGGWIVDSVQPTPIYGAAVLLIDEALQVTSLRMYNQATSARDYIVRVEESTHVGTKSSSFHERIRALVQPSREPWKTFSETVAAAVTDRARILQTKINL